MSNIFLLQLRALRLYYSQSKTPSNIGGLPKARDRDVEGRI